MKIYYVALDDKKIYIYVALDSKGNIVSTIKQKNIYICSTR